jgi:hypothetical protein
MNRFALLLLLVTAGAACGNPAATVTLPGAGDATATRGALAALNRLWPGARPAAAAACSGGEEGPAALNGDFNGDGTPDVVLWVNAGGTDRLVAVMTRIGGEYLAVPVETSSATPAGSLEVGRRGTNYQLASLVVDSFYGLDTIVTRACDGARTAWFWTGSRFDAQALAN